MLLLPAEKLFSAVPTFRDEEDDRNLVIFDMEKY